MNHILKETIKCTADNCSKGKDIHLVANLEKAAIYEATFLDFPDEDEKFSVLYTLSAGSSLRKLEAQFETREEAFELFNQLETHIRQHNVLEVALGISSSGECSGEVINHAINLKEAQVYHVSYVKSDAEDDAIIVRIHGKKDFSMVFQTLEEAKIAYDFVANYLKRI